MWKPAALLLMFCLSQPPAFADARRDQDIEVNVQTNGEEVSVDVAFSIPATPQQAWAVLTDFERMASFISNLRSSKIVEQSAYGVRVQQRGVAEYGPIAFPFESVREIRLIPFYSIRSRQISGNMRKMEGLTQLVDEGDRTRIVYHADTVPGVWIPPIAGKAFVEHETREQFREIRDEILKRKSAPK